MASGIGGPRDARGHHHLPGPGLRRRSLPLRRGRRGTARVRAGHGVVRGVRGLDARLGRHVPTSTKSPPSLTEEPGCLSSPATRTTRPGPRCAAPCATSRSVSLFPQCCSGPWSPAFGLLLVDGPFAGSAAGDRGQPVVRETAVRRRGTTSRTSCRALGNTQLIIATCAVAVAVLYWKSRQWWYAAVPALAVMTQSVIFFFAASVTERAIDRPWRSWTRRRPPRAIPADTPARRPRSTSPCCWSRRASPTSTCGPS